MEQAQFRGDGRLKLLLQRRGAGEGACPLSFAGRRSQVALPPWKITEIVL